jgi:hypothetical protein
MTYKNSKNAGLGGPNFIPRIPRPKTYPVGTILRGTDDGGLGDGEFIFLKATVACAAGDWVVYNIYTDSVALLKSATHAGKGRPVAVALAALDIGDYGWFQIQGLAAAMFWRRSRPTV